MKLRTLYIAPLSSLSPLARHLQLQALNTFRMHFYYLNQIFITIGNPLQLLYTLVLTAVT